MTGVATKFRIADLVFAELATRGDPSAALLNDPAARPFAYLGAMGSALGDFMSARPDLGAGAPNTPYFAAWRPLLTLIAGTPAAGTNPGLNGLYRDLSQLRTTLAKLQDVIARQAKFELLGMIGELNALPAVITDLQGIVGLVSGQRITVGLAILGGRPADKVAPSADWLPRDALSWSATGRFLRELHTAADASGDARLKAYALGATVGYAAELCGSPYVNSVVGAPYRNHWWRHRWISNYIDAWVYGYYQRGGATAVQVPASGVPNPLYTNWPSICSADLQKEIQLPGTDVDAILASVRDAKPLPDLLPQAFVDFFTAAYTAVYGASTQPRGVDGPGIQSAYALSWLTLWFQTSDAVIPCVPLDQLNYPDNCGARPDWVAADGSTVTGGGPVSGPPPASRDTDPSVAEVISGIVLAIIGIASIAMGNVLGGIEALVAAGALIADGLTDPDWEQLRCYAGWTMAYLYNLTDAMHQLFKWSGFGYPYASELAHNGIAMQFGQGVIPPDAALNTVRSQVPSKAYPASRWLANNTNWGNPPSEPLEPPTERAYPSGDPTWPYHFVDGLEYVQPATGNPVVPAQRNPLTALPGRPALVLDAVEHAARRAVIDNTNIVDVLFGNAVEVSLELITRATPDMFLDWDLDGDPGVGYPSWLLPAVGAPRSAAIPE